MSSTAGLNSMEYWFYGFIGHSHPPSEGVTARELLESAFRCFLDDLESDGDPIIKMSADEFYALAQQKVPLK